MELALDHACCQWEESASGYLRCLCARPATATLDLLTGLELARRWKRSPDAGLLLGTLAEHMELLTSLTPTTPPQGPPPMLSPARSAQPVAEETL